MFKKNIIILTLFFCCFLFFAKSPAVKAMVSIDPSLLEGDREPVIIVPGIMGSYLYDQTGEEVWPSIPSIVTDPWDFHLNKLALPEDGEPVGNSVLVPNDIFRNILDKDFFQGLIAELENDGYVEGENLFVFPYDWRWPIEWIAGPDPYQNIKSLSEMIEDIKYQTGFDKVNIVAHSMGGLVAKKYMKNFSGGSVNRFIDIGTPHLGSPDAFKTLMYGDNLGILFLNQERIKTISQNISSIYQLLPSRNYFSDKPDYSFYVADIYDLDNNEVSGNLNYDQSIEFLKNTGRNNLLLEYNDSLHSQIDNYSPQEDGVATFNIVGGGNATIGKIYVLNKEKTGKFEYGLKYINGDSTVPLDSAKSLLADEVYYVRHVKHAYLPSANGVRQLVDSILGDWQNDFDFSDYANISRGVNNSYFSGTQISYHSPIELHVYDEDNNHVGPNENGDIEIGIEGIKYDVLEENKFVFLPEGKKYRVIGRAIEEGSFNARVENIDNGEYVQTVYYNEVPLNSASANVQIEIFDGQTEYFLEIDQDGDQVFEQLVVPSAITNEEDSLDLEKPETDIVITGVFGDNGWYVSEVVVDFLTYDNEGGSGLLKTEYSLDNKQSWQIYEGPFAIDQEGTTTIFYQSTDRAGNVEKTKEQKIKIDATEPDLEILTPFDEQDFFRFDVLEISHESSDSISGISTASLSLDGKEITTATIDLKGYHLGEYILKVEVKDLAGNKAKRSTEFNVIADINSAIEDVEVLYGEGEIYKEMVKNNLLVKLKWVERYEDKHNQAQEKNKKNNKKIKYLLNKVSQKPIVVHYRILLAQLDFYKYKKWISQNAYDIIKEDLEYLINNLK